MIKDDLARARGETVPDRRGRGAKPGFKPVTQFVAGNKAAVKHGAYAAAFVTPEEKERFLTVRQEVSSEFKKELGPDKIMLDMAALLVIRHGLAMAAGEIVIAGQMFTQIITLLEKLKATKSAREGTGGAGSETSPAEWASDMLAEAKAKEAARSATGEKPGQKPAAEATAPTVPISQANDVEPTNQQATDEILDSVPPASMPPASANVVTRRIVVSERTQKSTIQPSETSP